MVFVNLDGNGPDFSTHIAELEQRWSSFTGVGGLNDVEAAGEDGSLELEFHANWKLAIENYCESYHLPWVHPSLNSYCLLYTSPSPRDLSTSRMPSSA